MHGPSMLRRSAKRGQASNSIMMGPKGRSWCKCAHYLEAEPNAFSLCNWQVCVAPLCCPSTRWLLLSGLKLIYMLYMLYIWYMSYTAHIPYMFHTCYVHHMCYMYVVSYMSQVLLCYAVIWFICCVCYIYAMLYVMCVMCCICYICHIMYVMCILCVVYYMCYICAMYVIYVYMEPSAPLKSLSAAHPLVWPCLDPQPRSSHSCCWSGLTPAQAGSCRPSPHFF